MLCLCHAANRLGPAECRSTGHGIDQTVTAHLLQAAIVGAILTTKIVSNAVFVRWANGSLDHLLVRLTVVDGPCTGPTENGKRLIFAIVSTTNIPEKLPKSGA